MIVSKSVFPLIFLFLFSFFSSFSFADKAPEYLDQPWGENKMEVKKYLDENEDFMSLVEEKSNYLVYSFKINGVNFIRLYEFNKNGGLVSITHSLNDNLESAESYFDMYYGMMQGLDLAFGESEIFKMGKISEDLIDNEDLMFSLIKRGEGGLLALWDVSGYKVGLLVVSSGDLKSLIPNLKADVVVSVTIESELHSKR